MKEKILGVLGAIIIGGALIGQPVLAVGEGGGGGTCSEGFLGFKPWYDGWCEGGQIKEVSNEDEVRDLIWRVVLNVLFDLTLAIGYLAVGFVIWSGYQYIMSQGDPGKMTKAKKSLTTAITGTIIGAGATVIVNTLMSILDINRSGGWEQGEVTQERVQNIFGWAYSMAGLVAVIFIIKSGIDYMTSAGDAGKAKRATQGLIVSIVGLIIVILAAAITSLVTGAMGGA